MFKKVFITFCALFLMQGTAQANLFEEIVPNSPSIAPYVGIDLGVTMAPTNKGFPYNIHAGIILEDEDKFDVGFEAFFQGYTNTTSDGYSADIIYKHSLFGVNALLYYQALEKMNVFGGLGLNYHLYSTDIEFKNQNTPVITPDISSDDNKVGFTLLAGVQYYVLDNVSVRAQVKRLFAFSNLDFTIGANFHF